MKKGITILLLSSLFLLGLSPNMMAQKFGYLNFNNLVVELPETKVADSKLQTYSEQLGKSIQAKGKALQEKFMAAQDAISKELWSPKKIQEEEAAITQEQQALAQEEQNAQQQVLAKREELYKPIFEKVNKAIEAVGKEGGYLMIFNESTGVLLYDDKTDDVTELVKAKL